MRLGTLAIFLAIGAMLLPGLALAADPITVGTLFGDLRETLLGVASVVASGIVGMVAWGVWRLTGVKLDETVRAALQSALENGIHAGLAAVQGAADRARPGVLDNEVIQVALGYVRAFAPGAIRHFGLTDDELVSLLRAQLGRIVPAVPVA